MKNIKLTYILFLFLGITYSQTSDSKWLVSLGINGVSLQNNFSNPLNDGILYDKSDFKKLSYGAPSVSIFRHVLSGLSFGSHFALNSYQNKNAGKNINFFNLDATLKYGILTDKRVSPYLKSGWGFSFFDTLEDGQYDFENTLASTYFAGIGIKIRLLEGFNFFIESSFRNTRNNINVNYLQHSSGISFGLNSRDTDKDGIPNKKDKCPLIPGLEEFEGCPDTDNDGIIDSEDKCPEEAGKSENNGCPSSEIKINDLPNDQLEEQIKANENRIGLIESKLDLNLELNNDNNNVAIQSELDSNLELNNDNDNVANQSELESNPDLDNDIDVVDNQSELNSNLDLDNDRDIVDNQSELNSNLDLDNDRDIVDNQSELNSNLDLNNDRDIVDNQSELNSNFESDIDNDGFADLDDPCPEEAGNPYGNGCPDASNNIVKEMNMIGSNILFPANGFKLMGKKNINALKEIKRLFEENPKINIIIEGHASTDGDDSFNQYLSLKRAKNIRSKLIEMGANPNHIEVKAFGETVPLNNNVSTKKGSNRRVQFKLKSFDKPKE